MDAKKAIGEAARLLGASGTARYWINQIAFATAAGYADDAQDAAGALPAPLKFMRDWGNVGHNFSTTITKVKQGRRGTLPIYWADGRLHSRVQCHYFDISEDALAWQQSEMGTAAAQLKLANEIRGMQSMEDMAGAPDAEAKVPDLGPR